MVFFFFTLFGPGILVDIHLTGLHDLEPNHRLPPYHYPDLK